MVEKFNNRYLSASSSLVRWDWMIRSRWQTLRTRMMSTCPHFRRVEKGKNDIFPFAIRRGSKCIAVIEAIQVLIPPLWAHRSHAWHLFQEVAITCFPWSHFAILISDYASLYSTTLWTFCHLSCCWLGERRTFAPAGSNYIEQLCYMYTMHYFLFWWKSSH